MPQNAWCTADGAVDVIYCLWFYHQIYLEELKMLCSLFSGKEMIEMYFDFRLYRLWKSRQHSKLLDYDDLM